MGWNRNSRTHKLAAAAVAAGIFMTCGVTHCLAQTDKPNVVILMTDDTGWNDFGAYGGGANLGHPTPNIDQVASEGAVFHQLVRPGKLHGGPRLVHDRTHPDSLGPFGRGCAR